MKRKYKRPKNHLPQMSGVANDFFSVGRRKKHGSRAKFFNNQEKKKREAEEIKRINKLEAFYEKEIHLEIMFPPIEPIKPKNHRKHFLTLQKRLARLRTTEKFWPYVYTDLKHIEGKIINVRAEPGYKGEMTITVWAEGTHDSWNAEKFEYERMPSFFRKDFYVKNKEFIGMATGLSIVCIDEKTVKPRQLMAAQVLFDDKLFYIDIKNLIIKSRLFGSGLTGK